MTLAFSFDSAQLILMGNVRIAYEFPLRVTVNTPPEFFASSELVAMWLPTLRAGYALLGQYRPVQPIRPLDIDLLFLYGEDDDRVDPQGVAGWARYTRGRLIPHVFPGGHFYLQTRAVEVCARIAAHVAASPVRA